MNRLLAFSISCTLLIGGVTVADAAGVTGVVRNGDARDNFLVGGRGNDVLNGRGGTDRLVGAAGNDRLNGGPGYDYLSGGAGDDYINSKDNGPDTVDCGPGKRDRVLADKVDTVRNCEIKQR